MKRDNRVRLLKMDSNSGRPAIPKNFALAQVKGEYVAFLDSDDLWHPEKIEIQVAILERHNDLSAVSTRAIVFPAKPPSRLPPIRDRRISFRGMLQRNEVVNSSVLMRRQVLDTVGLIDEDLRIMEDYDYWLRMLRHQNRSILMLRRQLVKYRIHENNICANLTAMMQPDFYANEFKHFCRVYAKHKDYDPENVKKAVASVRRRTLRGQMRALIRTGQMSRYELLCSNQMSIYDRLFTLLRLYYHTM